MSAAETKGARVDPGAVKAIITDGAYHVLNDFALKDEIHAKVVQTLLDGVEKFEGAAARDAVRAEGPGQLHKHFPIEKIHLLEAFLMERLQDDLYYWSYRVGADTLGLAEPFYIDHLIVFRLHYPFTQAREKRTFARPPYPWKDRLRFALAAAVNWRIVTNLLIHRKKTEQARNAHLAAFAPQRYHGDIPEAARSHGPHIDTWYGHSYDGMNLWMAIDGVNDDNTVILYPEMFARPVDFDPENMYVRQGIPLPPPAKIRFAPGDLLVFNPELLHGTQVNISNETRVALTTRINPARPRFAPKAPFHFDHWYSSADLKRRNFTRIKVFPITENQGKPSVEERPAYVDPRTRRVSVAAELTAGAPLDICAASELGVGEKLAVDLENVKLLLWRDAAGLRAYTRLCPHIGVDLADGSHTEEGVFCPGHGIAFAWADGTSKCEAFKLRAFVAREENGRILVAFPKRAKAEQAAEPQPAEA